MWSNLITLTKLLKSSEFSDIDRSNKEKEISHVFWMEKIDNDKKVLYICSPIRFEL